MKLDAIKTFIENYPQAAKELNLDWLLARCESFEKGLINIELDGHRFDKDHPEFYREGKSYKHPNRTYASYLAKEYLRRNEVEVSVPYAGGKKED